MTTMEKITEITKKWYEFLEAAKMLQSEGIELSYSLTWTGDDNTIEIRNEVKKKTQNASKDAGYRILD